MEAPFKRKPKYNNSEQQLKKSIATWLKMHRAWVVYYSAAPPRRQSDGSLKMYTSQFLRNGVPDIICCWKGRFVAIEVKRPADTQRHFKGIAPKKQERGSLSQLQALEIADIIRSGGVAFVAYGLEDVIRVLAPEELKPPKTEVANEEP